MNRILQSRKISAGTYGFVFTPFEIIVYSISNEEKELFGDNWIVIEKPKNQNIKRFKLQGSHAGNLCVYAIEEPKLYQ